MRRIKIFTCKKKIRLFFTSAVLNIEYKFAVPVGRRLFKENLNPELILESRTEPKTVQFKGSALSKAQDRIHIEIFQGAFKFARYRIPVRSVDFKYVGDFEFHTAKIKKNYGVSRDKP